MMISSIFNQTWPFPLRIPIDSMSGSEKLEVDIILHRPDINEEELPDMSVELKVEQGEMINPVIESSDPDMVSDLQNAVSLPEQINIIKENDKSEISESERLRRNGYLQIIAMLEEETGIDLTERAISMNSFRLGVPGYLHTRRPSTPTEQLTQ